MRKKYLVMAHNYYPALGGAEKLFQSIAENIGRKGFEVDVLASNAKNSEMYSAKNPETVGQAKETINGVAIYRESVDNLIQRSANLFRRLIQGGHPANAPRNEDKAGAKISKRMMRFVGKRIPGADHLVSNGGPLLIGPHFPRFLLRHIFRGKKYTHMICGPFPTSVPIYGYLLKILGVAEKLYLVPCLHVNDKMHTGGILRFVARRADKIFVLTREEEIFLRSIGIGPEKIVEIGVGAEECVQKQGKAESNFSFRYVLHLSQEVPHKNIILSIDAMRKVWKRHQDIKLIIAGAKTKYSKFIDEYVDKLEDFEKKNIVRMNDFSDVEKVRLLDGCELMVMPSSHESFGIVFVEAWSRKKPVIGARVPAVKHLIEENVDGLLCENMDPEDLSQKILDLLENPDLSKKLGEAGHKKALKKYSWDTIINKIISV